MNAIAHLTTVSRVLYTYKIQYNTIHNNNDICITIVLLYMVFGISLLLCCCSGINFPSYIYIYILMFVFFGVVRKHHTIRWVSHQLIQKV